ncbi:YhgE/Pip domain-containing protein [Bifidobacterium callimiconis]|uniref:YhgE/Pip domain-containing protein n=1 Tax=Bifidobacterium callimiconis TaxID=2306973 RepID=UPI001BDC5346|nr:YhgE/Pip domain-containing protein [Bifidobacterium callimiconis]MBT1177718.1 YhgE/Pip domain-containing protein [Bifidobacterium callimiconis]
MRTIGRIFTRDILRLLRNPVAIVITLGVALIPSLYAWFNIIANWDPYSNTGNIQVAVANADQGASNDLVGKLNAGKQVEQQLKANHQLGWRFVSETQARTGVESGEYYAAIVIPKDFSTQLVNTIKGTGKPKISYYVNEKKNAIAPKITDTGANTIDEQINQTFISTVASTVVNAVKQSAEQINGKASTARSSIDTDLDQASTDLTDAQNAMTSTASTIDASVKTLDDAGTTLTSLAKQLNATQTALADANSALGETRKESLNFSNTLDSTLGTAAGNLSGVQVSANNAAGGIIGGFTNAQTTIDQAVSGQNSALAKGQQAVANVRQTVNGPAGSALPATQRQNILDKLDQLDQQLADQQKQANDFSSSASTITGSGITATQNMANGVTTLTQNGAATLTDTRGNLNTTVMPSLLAAMDSFSATTGSMGGTLGGLNSTLGQTQTILTQLKSTLNGTKTTLADTSKSLGSVKTGLDTTRTDLAALESSDIWKQLNTQLNLNATEAGSFMASPVNLVTTTVYPVSNYGSAVTPFYTNLALWVGGFVLIAIFKLEVDRENLGGKRGRGRTAHVNAAQAYIGRGLLLLSVALLQALIVTIGDLIIGIQCKNPVAFVFAGLLISFVYVNVIYALAASLKHIGKAVAVILVIVQIPGSSGMYPIEMMPDFFRRIYPFLPFTYGINAMRETIGGAYGSHYWHDLGSLLWFLAAALLLGLAARPYLLNLNALFDRRLGATDLMVAEKNNMLNERFKLTSVIKLLMGVDEVRPQIRRRAHRFFKLYPYLIRAGLVMIVVLPAVFLVLMFSVESKIVMLTAWITSIILIDVYLIVVEYTYESFTRQLGMSAMDSDSLRTAVSRRLHIPLPALGGLGGLPIPGFPTRHRGAHEAGSASAGADDDVFDALRSAGAAVPGQPKTAVGASGDSTTGSADPAGPGGSGTNAPDRNAPDHHGKAAR